MMGEIYKYAISFCQSSKQWCLRFPISMLTTDYESCHFIFYRPCVLAS